MHGAVAPLVVKIVLGPLGSPSGFSGGENAVVGIVSVILSEVERGDGDAERRIGGGDGLDLLGGEVAVVLAGGSVSEAELNRESGAELSVARADLKTAVEGCVFHQVDVVGVLVADVHVFDDAVGPVIDTTSLHVLFGPRVERPVDYRDRVFSHHSRELRNALLPVGGTSSVAQRSRVLDCNEEQLEGVH